MKGGIMKTSKYFFIVGILSFIITSSSICYSQFLKFNTPWAMNVDVDIETTLVKTIKINVVPETTKMGIIYRLDTVEVKSSRVDTVSVDTINPFVFAPSIGFDVFIRESKSGYYKMGIIPGVGYGLKYKPKCWKRTNYLIGVDLFLQGLFVEEVDTHEGFDYFNLDILPVLNVIDWFGIGYGLRFKIGLTGIPSETRWIFCFGLRKATS
jgi:hypothetical protein